MSRHCCILPVLYGLLSPSIGTEPIRAQSPVPAVESAAADAVPVATEVVVLVGSVDEDLEAARGDLAHALLQMPLNHLGMRLVERAVTAGEPPELDPDRVRAVGTFLLGDEQLPAWVWPWLQRQSAQFRMLHLGSLRPLVAAAGEEAMRAHLHRFGLGYDAREVTDPARITIETPRHELYPFESRPVYERVHLGPWNLDTDNTVWVVTRDEKSPRRPRAPIVTGRWGGIALQPWCLRIGGENRDRRWYADPFAFCREALGLQAVPAPDPAVSNGRRMFVLHVDGDGFESPSSVDAGHICGEVFRDRIVDTHRMPMTVSFIVASLTPELQPAAPTERMQIAKSILERPWVEAASHSVLHPLNWRRQLDRRALPRSVVWYESLGGYRHDMVAEVRESIAFVDRWLAAPGRPCKLMLWSGAANPPAAAIAAARTAGCENLNGGLFRWDALHDSVGFVSPWGKDIGGEWQVFAGAPNENEYPGFFTTMPGAFAHVDTTIERTGTARILKPANVYVHFYSVENPARLRALDELLARWVGREPTIPVFASTYAAAVRSAQFECRLVQLPDGYRCTGFRACRTLRFDGERRAIDWGRSLGLLGARRIGDHLYVSLARDDAEVRFAAAPMPWLHVEQADTELDDVVLGPRELRVRARGYGDRQLVISGAPALAPVAIAVAANETRAATDSDGRVVVRLPDLGGGDGGGKEVRVWLP